MSGLLEVTDIHKEIGYRTILKQVSFTLASGELAVVTGSNGAGKTTLLRIIAQVMRPSKGSVSGFMRNEIGYLGHRPMVYEALSCYENLAFFNQFYAKFEQERIRQVLGEVGLKRHSTSLARTLSRGMQQRLAIGRVLLSNAPLILMDEPTTGLDAEGIRWFVDLLANFQTRGRIVLLVTHELAYLAPLSSKRLHLDQGVLKLNGQVSL